MMALRLLTKMVTALAFLTSLASWGATIPSTRVWVNGIEGKTTQYNSFEAAAAGGVAYYCKLPANQIFQSCTYGGTSPPMPTDTDRYFLGYGLLVFSYGGQTSTVRLAGVWVQFICPDTYQGVSSGPTSDPVCWTPNPPPPSNVQKLSVTPSLPTIIPSESRTENRRVLTRSNVTLSLQNGTRPVSGVLIALQSNRGNQDVIEGPSSPTDVTGSATAIISTRNQPGTSNITGLSPANIQTTTPGVINWLPANYESEFLVTCYTIAVETDSSATPTTNHVCGLPAANTYRSAFLDDVRMQGSGLAANGDIIHYRGRGCYNTDTCARTASGACAAVGTTIAVDPAVIPRRSTVNVSILGHRAAQDGGGWINGYHIDDYMGPARTQCIRLGRRNSGISFINY